MTNTPEQFAAAGKAQLDTLVEISHKAFEGVEKLVELNLQAVRATLSESADTAKSLLSVKDVQELFAVQTAFFQPAADKAAAYSRQVYAIATTTQGELSKLAEAQFAGLQGQVSTMVEGALKNAPAGSESAVAMVKQAITAANNAVETAQKAAKQAAGVVEANVEAMAASATQAAKAASSAAPKARRAAA